MSFLPCHLALLSETPTFDVDEHELVKRNGAVVGHHFSGLYASQVYVPEVFFTCQSGQGTTSQSWVFGHWQHVSVRKKKKKKRKHIFNIIKEICLNNFSSSHVESIQWLTCDLKSHSSPLGSSWPLWLLCWVSAQCKPVSGRLELPGHVEGFSSLLFYGRASLTACALLLMWLTWWGGRGNHTQTTCEKHSETVCTNF